MSTEIEMTTIRCDGGEPIGIERSELARRSRLFREMNVEPTDSIVVPFGKSSVQAWVSFHPDAVKSFTECVAVLKVADFLQDDATVTLACKAAVSFLQPRKKRPRTESVVAGSQDTDVELLKGLSIQLGEKILRADASSRGLNYWMRKLGTKHPLAVAAAIEGGSLAIDKCTSEQLEFIFQEVSGLTVPIQKLSVTLDISIGGRYLHTKLKDMKELRCLEMHDVYPSIRIPQLPNLTRLSVTSSGPGSYLLPREFTQLTSLQSRFAGGGLSVLRLRLPMGRHRLDQLSALSRVSLAYKAANFTVADRLRSELRLCESLASLSLVHDYSSSDTATVEMVCASMKTIISALSEISRLAHLKFPNFCLPDDLGAELSKLTNLKSLDLHSSLQTGIFYGYDKSLCQFRIENFDDCFSAMVSAIHKLTCLQHFSSWDASSEYWTCSHTTKLLAALTTQSLTGLCLNSHRVDGDAVTSICGLTNLQELHLCKCKYGYQDMPDLVLCPFSRLTMLLDLSVAHCNFPRQAIFDMMQALPVGLTALDLSGNELSTDEASELTRFDVLHKFVMDARSSIKGAIKASRLSQDAVFVLVHRLQEMKSLCEVRLYQSWKPDAYIDLAVKQELREAILALSERIAMHGNVNLSKIEFVPMQD